MVGVAVVVFISALVTGLQSNTIRRTLGAQAHIVAKPVEPAARVQIDAGEASIALVQTAPRKIRSIDNWQQVMTAFEAVPGVVAASPMASGPAIALRGEGRNAVTVFGVDLARYDRIVDLRDKLAAATCGWSPVMCWSGRTRPATSAPTSVTASPSRMAQRAAPGSAFRSSA